MADDEMLMHAHEPGAPRDFAQILAHNLMVAINRLEAQSEALDTVVTALRSVEERLNIAERRLAAVERTIPFRRPDPPKPLPPNLRRGGV